MQDSAIYAQETSVGEVGNILTPPRSDLSPENCEGRKAVFSQPPQSQMPLIYNNTQRVQQQNFNAYIENCPYQNSWNYPNYYGHNYYPSVHGHSSRLMQPAVQNYQQPHHSQLYGNYNGSANIENQGVNARALSSPSPSGCKYKKRISFSAKQISKLEETFKNSAYVSTKDKANLASELKMSVCQIKTWFQNRRSRTKNKDRQYCYTKLKKNSPNFKGHRFTPENVGTASLSETRCDVPSPCSSLPANNNSLKGSILLFPLRNSDMDSTIINFDDTLFENPLKSISNEVVSSEETAVVMYSLGDDLRLPGYISNDSKDIIKDKLSEYLKF
ncbi:unnamed protein product [Psylliodes chrysocephalus]|uniref:Homeobox domain-containing protein n=1 Tax=Psylliodes chrysocephalus TaxID=3402493 RepID=A0A9P0D935_9CUCU|nr:unnamed protein product [Psylliodes chrysocephala]